MHSKTVNLARLVFVCVKNNELEMVTSLGEKLLLWVNFLPSDQRV